MKTKLIWGYVVILLASVATALPRQSSTEKDAESYIIESERQWVESVVTGDTSVVERIVADDFVGVDTDGSFYDKAKQISETRELPKQFVSNRLIDVKVRLYGDAAVARGTESWVRRTGTPLRGRWVWTDTWIRRNGKWQVVAAQDVTVPEPSK